MKKIISLARFLLKNIILLKKDLSALIFFVTSSCNSRCKTCFYWESLNKNDDLNLEEIKKFSQSMPKFKTLLLSGGEPFLHQDLNKIIEAFIKNNEIDSVAIPTNGLLKNHIVKESVSLSKKHPHISFNVNFSIDGLEKYHDCIRGVPGNFKTVIEAIKKLNREIKKENIQNLNINISSVICRDNITQIRDMIDYFSNLDIKYLHFFELIRGEARDMSEKNITRKELDNAYKHILNFQYANYIQNDKSLSGKIMGFLRKADLETRYDIQKENYSLDKKWGFDCVAGKSICVLYANGDFALCELRPKILNIKDVDYNYQKIIRQKKYFDELNNIKKTKCSCTHVCFLLESMYKSKKYYWRLAKKFTRFAGKPHSLRVRRTSLRSSI